MITDSGPRVIEFNARFGDPETQSILMRLETDLAEIFLSVIKNKLSDQEILWNNKTSICVVLASKGYPGAYEKGQKITGLMELSSEVHAFHAGTAINNRELVTNSGRVLGITCIANNIEAARTLVYSEIKKINYNGITYRNDIGIIVK
jgi:phosphoribosylamine--glycine ligase